MKRCRQELHLNVLHCLLSTGDRPRGKLHFVCLQQTTIDFFYFCKLWLKEFHIRAALPYLFSLDATLKPFLVFLVERANFAIE
jgi:hypothetical protein